MELVTLERFQLEVELWKSKGHCHVVDAQFSSLKDGGFITLIVPDYVYPEKSYFIVVGGVE